MKPDTKGAFNLLNRIYDKVNNPKPKKPKKATKTELKATLAYELFDNYRQHVDNMKEAKA